jgi:hypothetical protein
MRKILIAILAAGGIVSFLPMAASAAPASGAIIAKALKTTAPVQDVRLYCYNRYTGQFLHWGPCGGYHWHRYHRWHRYYW